MTIIRPIQFSPPRLKKRRARARERYQERQEAERRRLNPITIDFGGWIETRVWLAGGPVNDNQPRRRR